MSWLVYLAGFVTPLLLGWLIETYDQWHTARRIRQWERTQRGVE